MARSFLKGLASSFGQEAAVVVGNAGHSVLRTLGRTIDMPRVILQEAGTDINLYKLFVEQYFNLLRQGGRCGIITPSGIYTDLGTKQLRDLLFSQTEITNLFGLSNERFIFETVHHAQKFCILAFMKGGQSESFEAAFRINPREAVDSEHLDQFLHAENEHLQLRTELIRRLSPDSLSIMEFKSDIDVQITEKLAGFPFLREKVAGVWNIELAREFDMGSDSDLFKTSHGKGRVPLVQGGMIHQFNRDMAITVGRERAFMNDKIFFETIVSLIYTTSDTPFSNARHKPTF